MSNPKEVAKMTAEILRRAATELRATVNGVDGDSRLVSDPDFKLAVADWLEEVAQVRRVIAGLAKYTNEDPLAGSDCFLNMEAKGLAVARAYLGEHAEA